MSTGPTINVVEFSPATWRHLAQMALETYGISAHFDSDDHPALTEGEPVDQLIMRAVAGGVAVALSKLAGPGDTYGLDLTEAQTDRLIQMAVDLDLRAVETESGA